MKKITLSFTILASLLASCGQQTPSTETPSETASQILTNDVSKLKIEDGWQQVVPGGYLRTTENRKQVVAVSLEGFKWALRQEEAQLRNIQTLSRSRVISVQEISVKEDSINFLRSAIAKWDDSTITMQKSKYVGSCVISASAMGASTGGSKAYANTNCPYVREQGSNAYANAGGYPLNNSDNSSALRYSSGTEAVITGVGGGSPCTATASAGIINEGYISDQYYSCY